MDRNKTGSGLVSVLLLAFIFMAPQHSYASFLHTIRRHANNMKPSLQIAPASAPSPGPGPTNDGPSMIGSCTSSVKSCNNQSHHDINIAACLISSQNAKTELYLLVQNHGESSIEVFVKANTTSQHISIPKHGIEKINVTDGRNSSIVLNAGNDNECVIQFKSPMSPTSFFWNFSYDTSYVTPLNGVYLLLISAVILGGTWACCVMGKKGQRVDGVPYRELEMSGNGDVEDGWDRGWDDDWGEIKPVRSPRERQNGDVSTNGLTSSRSLDRDGWENTWED